MNQWSIVTKVIKAMLINILVLLAGSIAFFGTILVGLTISDWQSPETRASWPTTRGIVLNVESNVMNPGIPRGFVVISYRYDIGGKSYDGLQEMSSDVIKEQASYTPERWVQVHYNPEDYTESVVEVEGYSKRQKDIDLIMILTILLITPLAMLGTYILTMRHLGRP